MRLRTSRVRSLWDPRTGCSLSVRISRVTPARSADFLQPVPLLSGGCPERDELVERAPGFQPRQIEEVGDDARETNGLALELRREPRNRRGIVRRRLAEGLGDGLDGGGGCLQLVRGVGDEVASHVLESSLLGDVAHDDEGRAVGGRSDRSAQPARRDPGLDQHGGGLVTLAALVDRRSKCERQHRIEGIGCRGEVPADRVVRERHDGISPDEQHPVLHRRQDQVPGSALTPRASSCCCTARRFGRDGPFLPRPGRPDGSRHRPGGGHDDRERHHEDHHRDRVHARECRRALPSFMSRSAFVLLPSATTERRAAGLPTSEDSGSPRVHLAATGPPSAPPSIAPVSGNRYPEEQGGQAW